MLHFMLSLNLVELKQILGSVLSIGGCREKRFFSRSRILQIASATTAIGFKRN